MKQRTLRIEEATIGDLDLVMRLEEKGFAPSVREKREIYAKRIDVFPQGALLGYLDSECVGCFFSEIWRDEALYAVDDFVLGHDILDRHDPVCGRGLYVSSITLDPAYRGGGLGGDLFRACMDQVCGKFPVIGSVHLLVSESWESARAIYRKSGFSELWRFPRFFDSDTVEPEDGILMRKAIVRGHFHQAA